MCWSAEADLVAGLVLGSVGLTSLGLVRHWRQFLLGAFPLLLASHQLVEMRVWQTLHAGADGRMTAHNLWTAGWGAIAMPVLAGMSSIALVVAFPHRWKRLLPSLACGLVDAGFGTYAIATHGVTAVENHHVLDYSVPIPFVVPLLVIYQLATWGGWLVVGNRYIRDAGLAIGAVGGLAAVIDHEAYYSIWCSFGAIVSGMMIRWLWHENRTIDLSEPPVVPAQAGVPALEEPAVNASR